jgi:hypothetical protein
MLLASDVAVMGFIVCTFAFGACGIWYESLSQKENLKLFQFLYYLSTFFGQVDLVLLRPFH